MDPQTLEGFVDADEAATFLSVTRRRILELARAGEIPAHPLGSGKRKTWRFLRSEVAAAVAQTEKSGFASRQRTSMVRPQAVPGAIGTEG